MRDFGRFFLPCYVTSAIYALQRYCTRNLKKKNIPRKETARPQSQFLHSYMCELFIYFHNRLFGCNKLVGPIRRINNSLTDVWIRKLGTRPRTARSLISGNAYFESSLQCAIGSQLMSSSCQGGRYGPARQAVRTIHHSINHTCRVLPS